jgi:multiple antibiotic resistance protein
MTDFFKSTSLILALLNPFLVVVYLIEPFKTLVRSVFLRVMIFAGLIAGAAFCCFAILGDAIFSGIQAEFASFQIFGGIIFLLIGVQFVFRGPSAIQLIRGDSRHIAGSIAMPVLVGPGTIGASIIIGKRHDPLMACAAVLVATAVSVSLIIVLKLVHDYVRHRREALIERYIEIAGRITALYVGTLSIEMIMQGVRTWLHKF